jgi:phi13 family phage major tail protein
MAQQVFEFRGVDNLYVAEVTKDDATGYVCSTPIHLAPVAEIGKNTDSSTEAHYYDNKAMIVINSESADTISITMAPPELQKLAMIIGKSFDANTGMMVDSPRQNKYFAIMYRTKGTDGKYRYVSRLKGQFTIPEEVSATENDGTDSNNTSVTFTGIYTEYEFTKGIYNGSSWEKSGVKGIVVDTRYELANVANFFSAVQTPDTISGGSVSGIAVVPSTLSLVVGETAQLEAVLYPAGTSGTVTWSSSSDDYVTVTSAGLVEAVAAGTATITATCNGKTDTCTVSVSAGT